MVGICTLLAVLALGTSPAGDHAAIQCEIDTDVAQEAVTPMRGEVFAITSHGISPDVRDIHMKAEWLERILAEAQKLGLRVIGFDELPPPDGRDAGGFFRTFSRWWHLNF